MWQWASMIRWGRLGTLATSVVLSEGGTRLADARLPLLARAISLLWHHRRLVQQPRAGVRIELHDLEVVVRRRAVEVELARRVQRAAAAHVHLQTLGAEGRHVLEEDHPL